MVIPGCDEEIVLDLQDSVKHLEAVSFVVLRLASETVHAPHPDLLHCGYAERIDVIPTIETFIEDRAVNHALRRSDTVLVDDQSMFALGIRIACVSAHTFGP
jgi:hypothetical protein